MAQPWRDVAGVRVEPAELRFAGAVPGRRYRAALSVHNRRGRSCRLQLLPPRRPQFKLIVENPEKPVASGLKVTAVVEYYPDSEEDLHDRLLLLIEEDIVDIPLLGLIPCCYLEIEPEINFGTVIVNSKIINKEISITNHGSSPGTFKLLYDGVVLVNIEPTSGVVEPKTVKMIEVGICTDVPRIINEVIKVELEGHDRTEIWIKAVVVEQVLKVLGVSHGNEVKCIHFGSVYFGSSKTEQVFLYNKSPECLDWVAVLEDNATGGEMGTDLQKATDAFLEDLSFMSCTKDVDVSTLMLCIPNQGTLLPYQRSVITLSFSPTKFKRAVGLRDVSAKQDYVLFLRFEAVGSKGGFLQTPSDEDTPLRMNYPPHMELALTGSGVPVMLTFNPGPVINFMNCFLDEQVEVLCKLKNESESLPVTFSFRKIAHFHISPEKGKIEKHSTKEVIFSFTPNQIGIFKKKQVVDVIGLTLEENNSQILKTKSFHQIHLRFIGVCKSKSKNILFKINPGITPMISNPAGQFVPDDTGQCTDIAPVAILKSTQTQIHTHQINRNCKNDALIAFPNDRSASIRPFERHKKYRTIFTKTERYNYVDPQFSYTDFEQLEKEAHKEYYTDYIYRFRQHRLQKDASRQFDAYNNSINIGLKPADGLISPKISITDIPKEVLQLKTLPLDENCLLTSRKLEAIGSKSSNEEIWDGLNAVPISAQEKEDCSLTLTPKQLHQIHIGPSTINFGDVCVKSISFRRLHIINNLSVHIWVQIEIEPEELQQTSPLSQVVPPLSKAYIPIVFETNTLGIFQKSFTYTINNGNTGHVLVIAKAVPVELQLSAKELIINPIPGYLAETEFRRTVRVCNRRNYSAEFSWKPIITDKNTSFSIRPSKGFVEPYRDLECEVVWHPAFHSSDTGEFNLCVHQGNTIKLKCFAKLGATNVQFVQQRIHFSHAPLGLCTCKTAILQNIGYNHAYFQVLDSNPLPGMIITPPGGVIPVGGHTDLTISFTPNAKVNFDTRVEVAVRNSRVLVLRITGSVEVPEINISVELFDFDGVYVGSTKSIPFLLQNKKQSCTRVEFDLSKYKDFELNVSGSSELYSDDDKKRSDRNRGIALPCVFDCCPLKPHLYFVYLEGKETLVCSLSFMPKEVAAYDFTLPVSIPQGDFSWTEESSIPATSNGSVKHIISPRPQAVTVPVPVCRVKAVVLTSPLEFSSMELTFSLHLGNKHSNVADESLNSQHLQKLDLMNISRQQLTWKLTCDSSKKAKEDGTFKFNLETGFLDPGEKISIPVYFCPPCPGAYTSEMLVYINDNPSQYRIILSGTVKSPKISFDPIFLMLMPVPLGMKTETTVSIIPQDYLRQSRIQVELPEFDREDGDRICPFSVQFPNGQDIVVSSDGTNIELICHVGFSSSRPVSYLENIFFIDEEENRFSLQVAAVAENCLLTLYPYLAFHRSDQQIIFKSNSNEGDCSTSEAVLDLCVTPQSISSSTSSASFGVITASTYEDSTSEADTFSENEFSKMSESDSQTEGRRKSFESSLSPDEKKEEYIFFQKVLTAVQNWFSLFGWSKGPNPVSIPYSLRRDMYKVQLTSSELFKQKLGKDTVYDMLLHLSGQLLPGVTSNQTLSVNPIRGILQLCWQHSALLAFLESQGAYLPYVMPEFLLEPDDYRKWITAETFLKAQTAVLKKGDVTNLKIWNDLHLFMLEKSVFEKMSKRAWTDLLLQAYKVLVLPRVSSHNTSDPYGLEGMQSVPRIKSEPLSSNIYSTHERIILTWLNKHYEKNRKIVWKDCQKGEIPPMRWIINFDRDLLDGLVLAAQLAAYCPYLIATHFVRMYTTPETPEQCLHNCLIFVDAMHAVSLAIDIKATDICDPNPIMMLILCVYLYERLPYYLPKKTIEFAGAFHATVVKKVHLKNPSIKTLTYNATLVGREADDFSLPEGNTIIIPPKGQASVNVEFTSRFLHPAEAMLLLMSETVGGIGGATVTFSLKSKITRIEPDGILKCKSPCYELKKVTLSVTNPFRTDGIFRVILLESTSYLSQPEQVCQAREVKQEKIFSSENNILSYKSSAVSEDTNEEKNSNGSDQSSLLHEFFSPMEILCLEGSGSAGLEINFLPFNLEKRYCTVFLVNEQIGEFVYLVEGQGDLPLPSPLLPMDSPHVLNVSSTLEGVSRIEPILRLKCGLAQTLEENLRIPLVNEAREMALAMAAQQQMSALEYKRRKITGTLESSSVRVAVALLGLSRVERDALLQPCKFPPEVKSVDYSVEVNMQEFFELPEKVSIPVLASSRVHFSDPSEKDLSPQKTEKCPAIELPIKFIPKCAGRYCCQILLKSSCDVRVYVVECIVNADHAEAELEFLSPAYQAVIQDIPISNMSHQDWKLEAVLEGHSFYGPPVLYVGPGETVQYPLMFKPTAECITMGRLILRNCTDGTESIFSLKGIGKSPLALDHVVIDCQVRQVAQKELKVPNYTKNKLIYKVSSDLPIVGGPPFLTVEPGRAVDYPLIVSPWKRGIFEGIISFVAEDEDQQQSQHNSSLEKTDGKQALQKLSPETPLAVNAVRIGGSSSGCKVWFSLKINSIPARPERKISVKCRALDTTGIDIPIINPTEKFLHLNVVLENHSLHGKKALTLRPKQTIQYRIRFSPVAVGTSDASVIFLSEMVGEFWYALKLIVEKPLPTTLPEIECELGKWVRLYIPLFNPTSETLELEIVNSNPSNFSVETDPKQPLIVSPHSRTKVPVKFCPSALGRGKHKASIIFKCPELLALTECQSEFFEDAQHSKQWGSKCPYLLTIKKSLTEWLFYVSGTGLLPQLMEPTSISTCIDQHSSVIISFRNPAPENVLVDVELSVQEQSSCQLPESAQAKSFRKEPAFCLLLKQTQGIALGPRGRLDIPVLFIPNTMKLYEAQVEIHVTRENGENWPYSAKIHEDLKSITLAENGGIRGIRWIYPIHGIPEAPQQKSVSAVVHCRARHRVEQRVEVRLTGAVPGTNAMPAGRNAAVVDRSKPVTIQGEVQVTSGFSTTAEFLYELQYQSDKIKSQLDSLVGIHLMQKEREMESGTVTLIFNIVFAPNKPMRNAATLVVQCAKGGIWKFPLLFIAMEPEVDDVINIEAAGLNKEAVVGFRLTSQRRYPEPFTAYFLAGSDPAFTVAPQAGDLLPIGTLGTSITVGFKPRMYGRKHRGVLVIQTTSMQWTYEVNGLPPQILSPKKQAKVISTSSYIRSATVRQRNFLRENLELTTTAVSSPIKGAPLVQRATWSNL